MKTKVLIAGIGGASLGMEIAKALALTGNYELYGCDICIRAYGMFSPLFKQVFAVDPSTYVTSVNNVCMETGCKIIIPGAEQPAVKLAAYPEYLDGSIRLIGNDPNVVALCSDKLKLMQTLQKWHIPVPVTEEVTSFNSLEYAPMPCIIKPAQDTGGSAMVFFAENTVDAYAYAGIIRRSGRVPIIQEYMPDYDNEYTISVLHHKDMTLAGSIAIRRTFDNKLSTLFKTDKGLVSTGYTNGYVRSFPEIRAQAENIAECLGSKGPLNIQGRVHNGKFMPFEINPRFSASTYLRALAGFNEVDIFIQNLLYSHKATFKLTEGLFVRDLMVTFRKDSDGN